MTKTHRIEFRVSEADLVILTAGAMKAGVALSEFIREAATDRARRLTSKKVFRVTNALNQPQGEVQ